MFFILFYFSRTEHQALLKFKRKKRNWRTDQVILPVVVTLVDFLANCLESKAFILKCSFKPQCHPPPVNDCAQHGSALRVGSVKELSVLRL